MIISPFSAGIETCVRYFELSAIPYTYGKFFFDGKYAYFDNYNTAFKPFWKCGNMSAKVEVTNDTVVTVSDNEQVLETTEFV